jgi:hypothetical protein
MATQTIQPFRVNQATSAQYACVLVDDTGAVVAASALTTLTLTLTDDATGTALNGRTNQNVLNANNVTVDSSGNVVWSIQPADNVIVGTRELEAHTALWTATWSSGTKSLTHEVAVLVTNLAGVTP